MGLLLLVFGLLTDSFLAALVGLLGARRRIGFGWTFFLSVLFTPLVGLIVCLLSDKLPYGERKWGCLGTFLAILTIVLFVFLALMLIGVAVI